MSRSPRPSHNKKTREIKSLDLKSTASIVDQYLDKLKQELKHVSSSEREEHLLRIITGLKFEVVEKDKKLAEYEAELCYYSQKPSSPRSPRAPEEGEREGEKEKKDDKDRDKDKEKKKLSLNITSSGTSKTNIQRLNPGQRGSSFFFEEASSKKFPYPFDKPDLPTNVLYEEDEAEKDEKEKEPKENPKEKEKRVVDRLSVMYSADKLSGNPKESLKHLHAATPEKIIEKLTAKGGADDNMMSHFVLAHQMNSQLSPQLIFSLLMGRFGGPDKSREKDTLILWMREKENVQIGVLRFFKAWLDTAPYHFKLKLSGSKPPLPLAPKEAKEEKPEKPEKKETKSKDSDTLDKEQKKERERKRDKRSPRASTQLSFSYSSGNIVQVPETTLVEELAEFLNDVDGSDRLLGVSISLQTGLKKLKTAERPCFVSDPKILDIANLLKLHLDKQTLDTFALQLTAVEFEMMCKIEGEEFLKQKWNKDGKEQSAPNLVATIEWFNRMTHFFSTAILKELSTDGRSTIISNLILLANKCRELQNFNAIMEILASLHSPPISRLKKTWGVVNNKLIESFEPLTKLMSPKLNYKLYREALKNAKAPFVPYLGVFLTDLTLLDEFKRDDIDGLVNFDKILSFGETISELLAFRDPPYPTRPITQFRDWIKEAEVWDDNYIYTISKLREDDDAKNLRGGKGTKYFQTMSIAGPQTVSTTQEELSDRDWKLLLTCVTEKKYMKNDVIMEQDIFNSFLYRVKKGSVRIEKTKDSLTFQVATLGENSMFGEMSVLDRNGKTSARVVSNEDDTEIYQIELDFVFKIFSSEPSLSKRFFKNLAVTLAKRLREQSAAKVGSPQAQAATPAPITTSASSTAPGSNSSTEKSRSKGQGESTIVSSQSAPNVSVSERETKLLKKFGDANEIIIKEYQCSFKIKVNHSGSLLVMQKSLCFFAKVFGKEIKERIDFGSVKNVEKKSTLELSILTADAKKSATVKFKTDKERDDAYTIILSLWKKASVGDESTSSRLSSVKLRSTSSLGNEFRETLEEDKPFEDQEPLTKEDLELLLKGAKLVTYPKEAIVVQEGQLYQRLFQINKGTCRITKMGKPLGYMSSGEMFGEISFLEGSGAAVSVISDEEEVSLSIIEGYYINILFEMKPGFAGRFYHHLCTLLAGRLKK